MRDGHLLCARLPCPPCLTFALLLQFLRRIALHVHRLFLFICHLAGPIVTLFVGQLCLSVHLADQLTSQCRLIAPCKSTVPVSSSKSKLPISTRGSALSTCVTCVSPGNCLRRRCQQSGHCGNIGESTYSLPNMGKVVLLTGAARGKTTSSGSLHGLLHRY